MSTKTTLKRIALVAVSALGFGLLSVVPARAGADSGNVSPTAITAGTVGAVRAGQTVFVPITVTGSFENNRTLNLRALAVTGPTGSVFTTASSGGGMAAASFNFGTAGTSSTNATTGTVNEFYPTGVPAALNQATLSDAGTNPGAGESDTYLLTAKGTAASATVYLSFVADLAGTYTFTVINDANDNGDLTAGELSSSLISVVTSNTPASAEVKITGGTANPNGTAAVSIVLKDASGNVTVPSGTEAISLTASSTAVTLGASVLTASNFNAGKPNSGTALTTAVTSATATTTYTLTVASAGAISPAFSTTVPLTFTKAVDSAAVATATNSTTGLLVSTGAATTGFTKPASVNQVTSAVTLGLSAASGQWFVPQGSFTWTITDTVTAEASTVIELEITEVGGAISGIPGGSMSYAVPLTLDADGKGTFSVTTVRSSVAGAVGYQVKIPGSTAAHFGVTVVASTSGTLAANVSAVSAAPAGTVGIVYNLKNSYGANIANASVAVTVAGRNNRTISGVTDASGNFVASYTDAGTTGTSDSLSASATWYVGSSTYTASASAVTISYSANNTVSTVQLTSPNMTVAGTANDTVSPQNIKVGATGAQAATRPAITATVKTAAGTPLVGIPVTFSVAGTGVAVPSNAVTAYTNASGVASSSVYAWISGTYTVTATAGGVSGTTTVTFNSQAGNERVISAAASGNRVIATAKDRFGNPVVGVVIYARINSGTGYFGASASNVAQATTLNDGTATFVVSGGTANVTVSNISFSAVPGTIVGQTSAAKGFNIGGSDATAFTAQTTGTTTTAETGVGSSFDAAGVASATVEVATADAASEAANAAADAAAEAIDAANAATDAANLAAEAADAATVAAEEARDAADAATAAVEELATQVATLMAALKAQITTLANTVAKIAKKVRA